MLLAFNVLRCAHNCAVHISAYFLVHKHLCQKFLPILILWQQNTFLNIKRDLQCQVCGRGACLSVVLSVECLLVKTF